MMAFSDLITKRLRTQEGATTMEFLMSMLAVFGMIFLILQITLVFTNGILTNHALTIAAHEVAARGGLDDGTRLAFKAYLPPAVAQRTTGGCIPTDPGSCLIAKAGTYRNKLTEGNEPTCAGDLIDLEFSYQEDLWALALFGVPKQYRDVTIKRKVNVASQSSKENYQGVGCS